MARFTTHQGAPASCPGYAAERSEATQCGFLQTWPSEAHGFRNGAHRPGIWEFAVLALRLHIRIVKRNWLCILIFPKKERWNRYKLLLYLIYCIHFILTDIGYKVLEIVFYTFFVRGTVDMEHGIKPPWAVASLEAWFRMGSSLYKIALPEVQHMLLLKWCFKNHMHLSSAEQSFHLSKTIVKWERQATGIISLL